MKSRWTKVMTAGVLALSITATPTQPARAQMPVIDPANLAQSLVQVTHMVEQVRNQVRQIEQATAMLKSNPLQLSPELSRSVSEARALFDSAQGIAFEARQVGRDIKALYPETWKDFDLDQILGQSDQWVRESRQSLQRAMEAEANAARSIAATRGHIDRALKSSSDAEGQTGAVQASNQLLGIQAAQMAEIHALLIVQGRALETQRLEQIARDERGREIQRRAFPTTTKRTVDPARTAF